MRRLHGSEGGKERRLGHGPQATGKGGGTAERQEAGGREERRRDVGR